MSKATIHTLDSQVAEQPVSLLKNAVLVICASAVIAVCARITLPLPFTPVPLSPPLEDAYRPQSDDVYAAARHAVQWADVEEPVPVSETAAGQDG